MRPVLGMLVVLAAGVGFAQDKKDDKKPAKLDGKYVIVGMEFGGEKIPAEFLDKAPEADRTIVIKGNQAIATKGGKEDPATFKLDDSKKPAHITFTSKKAGGKEETVYGIYKLDGDTLTICAVEGKEADRPKEFKTEKGSMAIMMTLKKKDK
jgi:uncharacterized protein (TIGR03067 family)